MPRDDNNLYYDSITGENGAISTKPDTTSATRNDVAKGYGFRHPVSGEILFGTAEILPLKKLKLEPGDTVKLDPGFYRDGIEISVASLADYTYSTATAYDIKKNKTAWVNGRKVIGEGYIDKNVRTTASQDDIIRGKTAYNSTGDLLTGRMEVKDNLSIDIMKLYDHMPYFHLRDNPNMTPLVKNNNAVSYDLDPGYYRNIKLYIPDLEHSTTADPYDIKIGKKAVSMNRLVTGIYDPDREFKNKIRNTTNLRSEHFLAGRHGYDTNGELVEGKMPNSTNINPIVLSDNNSSYTIPRGYHDGTGKVKANLKLTNDFSNIPEMKRSTEYNVLAGNYFFDDNGKCKDGRLILANWSPVFLNKIIDGAYFNTYMRYSMSDIALQNRKITFLKRTERIDDGKEFVHHPYSQYNILNSEFGNTVLAIPTELRMFSLVNHYGIYHENTESDTTSSKNNQYSSGYPQVDLIIDKYNYIYNDDFELNWFSRQLSYQEKNIIIDQIVVKFYNDISKKEDSLKYKITFPYMPYDGEDTVNEQYIKKCINACHIDYDGIDYENKEKYLSNKIKIYATCSAVFKDYAKGNSNSPLGNFKGANFGITFHVQSNGNDMYEKSTEINTNTYISQLWDSNSNIYIDIDFIGIHVKKYDWI